MNDIYLLLDDKEACPFTLEEVQSMVEHGEIPAETLCASPGMSAWEPISTIVQPREISAMAPSDTETPSGEAETYGSLEYDDNRFDNLMVEYGELSNYEAVNDWDTRAQQEVRAIVETLKNLDKAIAVETANLQKAKFLFEEQSFFKRVLGKHQEEEAIANRLSVFRQRKVQVLQFVSKLQTSIDFTPNTTKEKEELVRELKLRKKELQAQKREEAVTMAEIRKEARVRSVDAGKNWIGLYDSSVAADERRGIRYAKEAALRPHEDAKAAIERQLIQIERDLLWVEKFDYGKR